MSLDDKIFEVLSRDPLLKLAEVGALVGVSRQRVHQIIKAHGYRHGHIRDRREQLGLCGRCESPLGEGKSCEVCKARARDQRNKRLRKLKRQGRCRSCAKPLDRVGSYCSRCLPRINAASMRYAKARSRRGLCLACGGPRRTKKYCQKCADKRNENMKKVRLHRLSRGLCGSCGKNPLSTQTMCEGCAAKLNEKYRERKGR